MNFVAATLLLMSDPHQDAGKEEEKAFWVLCALVEDILTDYYTHDMIAIQSDADAFTTLLEGQCPDLFLHVSPPARPIFLSSALTVATRRWMNSAWCHKPSASSGKLSASVTTQLLNNSAHHAC
jgi:hypothetical protein